MTPRHINIVWTALLAATAITWALGDSGLTDSATAWAVPLIFALAALKGSWVTLDRAFGAGWCWGGLVPCLA